MNLLIEDGLKHHHIRDALPVFGMGKAVEAWDVDFKVMWQILNGEVALLANQFPSISYASLRVNAQLIVTV